jgi:hypothetical protein
MPTSVWIRLLKLCGGNQYIIVYVALLSNDCDTKPLELGYGVTLSGVKSKVLLVYNGR